MSTEKLTPESIMNILNSEVYEIGARGITKAISYEEGIQLIQQYADQQMAELQEKYNSQVKLMEGAIVAIQGDAKKFQYRAITAEANLGKAYELLDKANTYDLPYNDEIENFLESLKSDQ